MPSISDAARALAQRPRRRRVIVCKYCGNQALGTRQREYCSRACQAKAWRQWRREEGAPIHDA